MSNKTIDEKSKKNYLKEKRRLLSIIVGAEDAKQLSDEFYNSTLQSSFENFVNTFENSYLQKICKTGKTAMDREYYKQSTSKLQIIAGIMIATLAITVIAGLIIVNSIH